MAAKNQTQRIEMLEQQMAEVLAGQSTMLQGQIQLEARIESKMDLKLENFDELLRNQISNQLTNLFGEQFAGIAMGKGKEPTETPIVHTVFGSSSGSGTGPNKDRNDQGILSPAPMHRVANTHGHAAGRLKLDFPKVTGKTLDFG